ncbi:helix-turn-helix domain-containing protein [Streptomyces smyrnaeus]|uniref:Helix-turn-helix domain-containing protein n=1 Tax=Streptomyces smyrnaeus TaxID=1387713 RepID=A0ABS3XSC1_9ACTN|nr:XRE family transcriptional regulator [Streptomyces smyrnaeus]MBO8198297.1 helix-turn-helix domain-containing protein [Streptomyces smyrnaeus]
MRPNPPHDEATGPEAGDIPAFAPRMRLLRRRSGLSLEASARRAGLSPAHLSRLETGKRQPSLPLLLTLARVYGTTVGELLGETTTAADSIVRGDEMEPVDAGGWRYRQAGQAGRAMQALRVHVPRGPQGDLVRVHPGEEWIHVQRGELRLSLDQITETMGPGDSAHFDSLTPHRLQAVSAQGADLLFVHTLLQSPTADLCVSGLSGHPAPGPAAQH